MNSKSLTFTRFIAAVLVVIFHYGKDVYPFNQIGKHLFSNGNLAVSYFFFLSGFVMSLAYYEKVVAKKFCMQNFWINRISRIYPVYFLALFLVVFQMIYFWNQDINLKNLFSQIFLIQAWSQKTVLTLNYPGWSLSVELFFYLLFPIIIFVITKLTNNIVYLICFIIYTLSQILTVYYNFEYHPLIHLNTFICGVVSGIFILNNKTFLQNMSKFYIFIFCIGVGGIIYILSFKNLIEQNSQTGLLSPLYFAVIIGLIFSKRLSNVLSNSIFVFLGDISYSIYILQYPSFILTRYLNDLFHGVLFQNKTTIFYLSFCVLLFLSTFTYLFIEKPVRNYFRK